MTASTLPADASARRAGAALPRRALGLVGTLVFPAAISLLVLRYLLPSPLAGASGGLAGFFSWVGDRHPLFAGLAIFLMLSEVGRYWARRIGRGAVAEEKPAAQPRAPRSVQRLLTVLAAVAVVAFVTRSSLVATFRVVGPSMLPTLEIGDRVLVNRLAYGLAVPLSRVRLEPRVPQRGDLVVFRAEGRTGSGGPESLVKRVIGIPGDQLSFDDGKLHINGWRVPTCDAGPYLALDGRLTVRGRLTVEYLGSATYLTVRTPVERPYSGYTVKPGEVFVIGDDRGVSSDSRLWNEGHGAGVPVDILEGRLSRVLFGARPDHRLDFARVLAPPLDLKVRMPGLDLQKTDQRIANCLARRPEVTSPPLFSTAPGGS